MKKITTLMMSAMLVATTFTACTTNDNAKVIEVAEVQANSDAEIILFHGKQRCMNCQAIEKETQTLMANELSQLANEGKVKFSIIDFSTEEGKAMAEEFKVSFTSLFLVSPEGKEDLTKFAIDNARTNAEEFRNELKNKVMKVTNNL